MNRHSHRKQEHHHASADRLRLRLLRVFATGVILLLAGSALATSNPLPRSTVASEAGLPFIHNFDAAEYGGSPQNWSITQGPDGIIYVGNVEDGVLAFDGTRWRKIPVPNRLVVRSLTTAPDGRIYVGTVGDFGYLKPDANGRMTYVSLLDMVPAGERTFTDVWNIHSANGSVYFTTLSSVFRLHGDHISVIKPETSFHLSFLVNGTMYIREVDRGLMRIVDDRLQLVPGGAQFADKKIYALLPWHGAGAKSDQLLAGTRADGWFRFDGTHWTAWPTDADAALNDAALYSAVWLADGRLAVATLRGGLFLLNSHGHLLRRLTRASGLSTDVTLALFQDRQHGLWLATGDGVTHVDVDSSLTHFGERSGLQGAALDIIRHQGTLYAGTTEGLFQLVAGSGGDSHFVRLPEVPGQNWSFASVDDQLLVAGNEGVFSVHPDGSASQLVEAPRTKHVVAAQSLLRSRQNPSRVFVGYQDGVGALRWTGSRWIDEGRISGAQEEVRTLAQDAAGHLWLGLWAGGVGRLTLPADWKGPSDPRKSQMEHFGINAGLPDGQQKVVTLGGEVRFLTDGGIYRFDAKSNHFTPDADFANLFPDGARQVIALHQDARGDVWMYTYNGREGIRETGRAHRLNGHWQWLVTPFQPIAGSAVSAFHDDPDGVTWLGGDKGMFRYDPSREWTGDTKFNALIREVAAHDGRLLLTNQADAGVPEIPYAQNALRFEFAAPSYNFFTGNSFQVLLQGVDRGWSPWSSDAYRDYTNIHEGDYRFRVRARNVFGDEGTEATFDFRVLPPWYRTGWAWAIWIAFSVLVLGLLLRWRSATLRRRNHELAALVELRTTELAQANLALQDSNHALAERSVTDPLTGLKNRRYLYDHIAQDVAMSRRNCRDRGANRGELPLNSDILFLMVDIDHFKEINDTHGHAAGDLALQQFRDILQSVTRETDIPIRWGGEEFLIVARFALPDIGPKFAERIRAAVAAHNFDLGEGRFIRRTCSVGFATYPALGDEPDRLGWEQIVNLADECLYAAKHYGRNAWAGVMPLASSPDGEIVDAVRAALAQPPGPGPLHVATSWTPAAP